MQGAGAVIAAGILSLRPLLSADAGPDQAKNLARLHGGARIERGHGAHYVALRFTPAKPGASPIEVAEIAASGTVTLSFLDGENVLNNFAQPSDKISTIADPPNLGVLSPP